MLLYSLLSLTGYDVPLDEIRNFRQWGSRTPGHPESHLTPGVEITTGPLGAGFSMGVGMAIAERQLAARFNRPGHTIVDHYTYGICSDGDLMEGVASEAASLAGTLGLGKLIYLYDDNQISIEGDTDLAFTEDVGERFRAYGWHVDWIDGNDIGAVSRALEAARSEKDRPSLIVAKTVIAFGSPNKAGKEDAHGSPLGEAEVALTKEALGWEASEPFSLPDDAVAEFRKAIPRGRALEDSWKARFRAYEDAYPAEAAAFQRLQAGVLPDGWEASLPVFSASDPALATRVASGKVMNAIAPVVDALAGGSADLAPSTMTHLNGFGDFARGDADGRNIHFGVREHAMGNIVNGIAAHGGTIPYGATFLVFSDYMRPAIRLSAIMGVHVVWVFTHDSIGVGEDGPTHQPIEHLASLRAMPGLSVIRPADANETAIAWKLALERRGPTALVLSRQALPTMEDAVHVRDGAARGGYVLADSEGEPDVILMATGSEVEIAVGARELLAGDGLRARVVSLPSIDVFETQPDSYRESVLPAGIRARVSVEAAASLGWHRWVGEAGQIVAIDRFGASAPAGVLYKQFGFTAENVAAAARNSIAKVKGA
jgi:transketolase